MIFGNAMGLYLPTNKRSLRRLNGHTRDKAPPAFFRFSSPKERIGGPEIIYMKVLTTYLFALIWGLISVAIIL